MCWLWPWKRVISVSVFTIIAQYGFVCACVLLFPWRAWRHSVSMVLGCLCDTWSPGHPGPGNTRCLLGPDMHNANTSDGERGNTNSAVCRAAITEAKIFMRRILRSTSICSAKSARNHLEAALYNSLKHFCTVLIWAAGLKQISALTADVMTAFSGQDVEPSLLKTWTVPQSGYNSLQQLTAWS